MFRILTALRAIEPLQGLETPHLKKLAFIATETEFPADEIIYREGDFGQAIYLIQAGEVVIEMDVPDYGWVTLLSIGPGHLFGWSSLFPLRRKMARARVLNPIRAIVIDANQLRDLFRTDHELERAIMNRIAVVIADRVRTSRMQLAQTLASRKKIE
jgi:CRP-like cAMP-binding protein